MPLINVRLDSSDQRRARALRAEGVALSTLVRKALREEYARRVEARAGRQKPSRLVAQLRDEFPSPPEQPARPFRLDDRQAVRQHIAGKLRRSR
jgi:hypothetical protein